MLAVIGKQLSKKTKFETLNAIKLYYVVSQLREQRQVQNTEKANDIMTGKVPSVNYSIFLTKIDFKQRKATFPCVVCSEFKGISVSGLQLRTR